MSYHMKFMLPLLNESFTKEDFTKEAGFIEAYNYRFKKPTLVKQIFLLYHKPNLKILKMTNLRDVSTIMVNGEKCILYTLNIHNYMIMKITNSIFVLPPQDKLRIIKFWNTEDEDINEYTINSKSIRSHIFVAKYI